MKKNTLVTCEDSVVRELINVKSGESILYMGEIEKMPGHCVIALKSGKVIWGYHTDNFKAIPKDEI